MDALLVIDVQNALVEGAYEGPRLLDAINSSISKMRERGIDVVFIQHCHNTWAPMKKGQKGWYLSPELKVLKDDVVMEKTASDSFWNTSLEQTLRDRGVDHVYITGMQTEYCVDTTCRAAISKGFRVTLVSDAHTTSDSHLTASQIIDHHNRILGSLAHPTHHIEVLASTEI